MSIVERESFVYLVSRSAFSFNDSGNESLPRSRKTREKILLSAFDEMYEHGYQGMRIENILATTGLAKGALYHHFESKKVLGYAVVDEVIFAAFKNHLSPLESADDPLECYCDMIERDSNFCSKQDILRGCPLNNLAQEMSGLDEGFQKRLSSVFTYWTSTLASAVKRGKMLGQVKHTVNENAVALFIVSSIQGCIGTSKCIQSDEIFKELMVILLDYVKSLRK